MAVRSKRLADGDSAPDDTPHLIYTAGAGETVLVKDIHIDGGSGGCSRAAMQVSSGGDWMSVTDGALGVLGIRSIQPWIVLLPGDQLRVYSEGGTFQYWVSGAELEGLAD